MQTADKTLHDASGDDREVFHASKRLRFKITIAGLHGNQGKEDVG
jgi:hypothetical protein